jgi:FlaA1/EpsC-like NDP-sugar epimerase
VVVASRDEGKHWELKNRFKHSHADFFANLSTEICDVRDYERVHQVISKNRPNIIIAAQAMKQVDTCEANPNECIKTNINGTQNIIHAVENQINHKVECVCFISTDKACNPVNVYGMAKSISERLVLNASVGSATRYVVTRYGNVLSSKGSIVPLFIKQATDESCKAFTVTHTNMTRFLMTLEESVDLIDDAITHGESGTMWIPSLSSVSIMHLAEYFSDRYGKPFKIIGIRPGEKIHESLASSEEMSKCIIKEDRIVVHSSIGQTDLGDEYSSDKCLISKEELYHYMDDFLSRECL